MRSTSSASHDTLKDRRVTFGVAILIASSFWGVSSAAQSQGLPGSNQILADCKTATGPEPKSKSDEAWYYLVASARCNYFVRGAVSAYVAAAGPSVCIPQHVIVGQPVKIYVGWLERHPEHLHREPIVTLLASLMEAFPCVKP